MQTQTATAEERAKMLNNPGPNGLNYSIGNGYQDMNQGAPETSLLVSPVDFTNDDMHRIIYTTSVDICKLINSVFAPQLKDYYGCILGCDDSNPFAISLTLYFSKDANKNAAKGAISSLIPISDKVSSNNAVERIQRFKQSTSTSRKWKLNQETMDILMDFVRPTDKVFDRKNNKMKLRNGRDMNNFLVEQIEQSGYGYGYNTTSFISGFDPIMVISRYYGMTSSSGNPFNYRLQKLSPIYANNNMRSINYLMMLEQIDTKRLEDLFIKAGYASCMVSQLPIVRV